MPEPDFKTPTVYSRPSLSFGSLFGSAKERETYGGYSPRLGTSSTKARETYGTRSPSPARRSTATRSTPTPNFLSGLFKSSSYKTSDEYALDAVNNALSYPSNSSGGSVVGGVATRNTPPIDGGSDIFAALKNTAGAILQNIGSSGDGEEETNYTPASYGATSQADGILGNPVVLIGLVVGAGAVVYMATK